MNWEYTIESDAKSQGQCHWGVYITYASKRIEMCMWLLIQQFSPHMKMYVDRRICHCFLNICVFIHLVRNWLVYKHSFQPNVISCLKMWWSCRISSRRKLLLLTESQDQKACFGLDLNNLPPLSGVWSSLLHKGALSHICPIKKLYI